MPKTKRKIKKRVKRRVNRKFHKPKEIVNSNPITINNIIGIPTKRMDDKPTPSYFISSRPQNPSNDSKEETADSNASYRYGTIFNDFSSESSIDDMPDLDQETPTPEPEPEPEPEPAPAPAPAPEPAPATPRDTQAFRDLEYEHYNSLRWWELRAIIDQRNKERTDNFIKVSGKKDNLINRITSDNRRFVR